MGICVDGGSVYFFIWWSRGRRQDEMFQVQTQASSCINYDRDVSFCSSASSMNSVAESVSLDIKAQRVWSSKYHTSNLAKLPFVLHD